MRYFWVGLAFLGVLLLGGCHTQTTEPIPQTPKIRTIQAPESVFAQSDTPFYFRVDVTDPQGVTDIQKVQVDVRQGGVTFLSAQMKDDGQNGDIIPGDGQFTAAFSGTQFSEHAGSVVFVFTARDAEGHKSPPALDTVAVRSGRQNHPPRLLTVSLQDSVNLTVDSVFVLEARLTDPDGTTDILGLQVEMYPEGSLRSVFRDTLQDNGKDGDSVAGDGRVRRAYPAVQFQGKRGHYVLRLVGLDKAGAQSYPKLKSLYFYGITRNDPPVLSHVSAPDSISRSSVHDFVFSVQVSDPQGPEDIAEVYILVTKPDGTPSSGNPFRLNDRGQNGDAVAYDGIYSSGFQIPSGTALGRYIFEVHAVDVSGAQGNVIQHTITVIP